MALLKTDTRVFGTLNVNTAIFIGNTTSSINLVPFIITVQSASQGAFTRANNTVNANTGGTVTGNTVIRGNLIVTNTTTSISNATGALRVTGGAGISGNVYADAIYDGRNSNLPVGYLNIPQSGTAKTTNYTLLAGDVGEFIEIGAGGSVTVPDAIFSTGDAITIFNNTAANAIITLNITTAYIAGFDTDRATANLTTRGIATILFSNPTTCVIIGNVS